MAFQLRRGSNTDRLNIKLSQGELVYTTDTKKLFVGDGITVGGTEVSLNDSDINATISGGQSPAILAIVTKEFVDNLGINAVKLDGYSRDYYRNYNNLTNTPSILDSSNIQSLSRDSSFVSSVVDSSYVNNLVNTSYIQSKIDQLFIDTFDTHDSGAVQNMIDIAVAANDTVDSAAIVAQIINTVTQSFIDTFNTHDSIAVGNNIDSKVDQTFVRNFIDQSFIQAFINQAFINTFDTHDEVATLSQINSTIDGAYVRNSIDQAFINTFDTHDSAAVVGQINATVNQTFIDALDTHDSNIVASQIYTTVTQSFIDQFDTHDSAAVQAQIDAIPGLSGDAVTLGGNDSSYYLNYNNFSNTPNLLDSSEALNLINTSYIQSKIDQTFINTFDTHDSAIVDAQINAELATRTFYDSGAVQNQIDSAVTQSFIDTFDTHDSAAITGQITSTVNTSYVQGKIDQTFIDGFDTHDSVAIQNMINTTIAATDTHDSSAVLGQINATVDQTFVRNFVDQSFIDTFDTHDSVAVQNMINTTIAATDTHDSAAVQAQIDTTIAATDTHDSVAIQNQITSTVNQAFIDTFDTHDEVTVQAQIDSAVTQSFIDTFDTHDSSAVDAQIDAKLGTNVTVGGNLSVTGYIDGPEVFTIDPAAVGDATGKVVILGNLQVDGVQTTINSTEVSISDKNIVLADSATSAAEANGAGITVNGASATLQYVSSGDKWEFNKDVNVFGDISVSGTVDGRDVATDGTKLDGIEASATADQTGSQIKALYEGESNAFTDALFTKLAGIETGATADQTGAEIKALYEAEANAFTDAQFTKLVGIETGATADQTGSQIKALYEGESDTNAYNDAAVTKLAGIEASATADQTAAEILTAIKTVDGAASGLNADLLDGVEANQFLRSDVADTKTSGNLNFAENVKATFGDSANPDLQIYHDGANSRIADFGTGELRLQGTNLRLWSATGENYLTAEENGAVSLYYDNSAKIATTSTGVEVSGSITVDGDITFSDSDNIIMPDNSKIKIGTGVDLEIYHDGSHSYVDDRGTGDLRLRGNGAVKIMQYNNSEQMAAFKVNGAVELYHDNVKKFDTTSTGVSVTGTVTATAYAGDGSSLTGISAGATGGSTDQVFYENDQTVTTNYTISTNKNAMTAGPITVNSGVTVTIPTGSEWSIV